MEINRYSAQTNLETIQDKITVDIPEEVVKLLRWKSGDRVQITLTENGTVNIRNFDSTVQDSFLQLKEEVLSQVKQKLPRGYSIRSLRDLTSSNGYEICIDKPPTIRHSELQEFVTKVNDIAKKFKIRIEVI